MPHPLALRASSLVLAAVLAGCAATPLTTPGDGAKPVATEVLAPAALPPGSQVRADRSLIMGSGEQWVGRLVAEVGRDAEAAYRFFVDTYPAQGWTLVSAVRGKTSLIVLTKQDRTATVELTEGSVFMPSVAVLTVSPRNAQVSAPRRP